MKGFEFSIVQECKSPAATILIVYLGGTVGMDTDSDGVLKPRPVHEVLQLLPDVQSLNVHLQVAEAIPPIDSSNVKPEHWEETARLIAAHYEYFDGFLLLHGTDTMAYSASALSFLLQHIQKPVLFTGAQLPLTKRRSDGRENLLTALEIIIDAAQGKVYLPEVCIYFGGYLYRGNRTKKVESNLFDAFKSENYPTLAEAGVHILYHPTYIHQPKAKQPVFYTKMHAEVGLLKLHPGISLSQLTFIEHWAALQGLVIESYGSGNAPQNEGMIRCLRALQTRNVHMINISQCSGGVVLQGKYATSQHLLDAGVISGKDSTLEAALTKLMFVLSNYEGYAVQKSILEQSIAGEHTDF